jgi:hypothetical protein
LLLREARAHRARDLRLAALAASSRGRLPDLVAGFMSFDSMYALRQARTGIETGVWPPMVSYLWGCASDHSGQGGMFALGNALVFLGVAALGRALGARDLRILLAMLLLAYAPSRWVRCSSSGRTSPFGGLMAIGYAITLKAIDGQAPAVIAAAVCRSFSPRRFD